MILAAIVDRINAAIASEFLGLRPVTIAALLWR